MKCINKKSKLKLYHNYLLKDFMTVKIYYQFQKDLLRRSGNKLNRYIYSLLATVIDLITLYSLLIY